MATKKVVDISQFNSISNYEEIVRNTDGCIIRLGYRGYGSSATLVQDPRLNEHYRGIKHAMSSLNKPRYAVGVYWFTQATSNDEAIAEAKFVRNILLNLNFTGSNLNFPVYVDSEWADTNAHNGRGDVIDSNRRTQYIIRFCTYMKDSYGIECGLYASESWIHNKLILPDILNSSFYVTSLWIANYSNKPSSVEYDGHQYTKAYKFSDESGTFDMSNFYKWWVEEPAMPLELTNNNTQITLSSYRFVYDGTEKKPDVLRVENSTLGSIPLKYFNIRYEENIDATYSAPAGHASTIAACWVSISESDNVIYNGYKLSGRVVATFNIDPVNINHNYSNRIIISLPSSQYEYKGSNIPVEPEVKVWDRSRRVYLTKDKDYTIRYSSNNKPGNAYIYVKGTYGKLDDTDPNYPGNYTDQVILGFKIVAGNLNNNFKITGLNTYNNPYKYTGNPITPAIQVVSNDGSQTLEENIDYTVTYIDNNSPGHYGIVKVTGKDGRFEGYLQGYFSYSRFNMQYAIYTSIVLGDNVYDGKPKTIESIRFIDQDALYVTNKDANDQVIGVAYLEISPDNYNVSYTNNINAGSATAIYTGTSKYSGTRRITFDIYPAPIEDFECHLDIDNAENTLNYNGSEQKPMIVFDNGLVYDEDYTISYSGNKIPGTAKAIAIGKGNYKGMITKEFTIVAQTLQLCIAKYGRPTYFSRYRILDDKNYPLTIKTPDLQYQLVNDIDYKVEVSERYRMDGGFWLYYFKVRGVNYFTGTAEFRFRIVREEDVHIPTEEELEDDGVYEFGCVGGTTIDGSTIPIVPETAEGDWDWGVPSEYEGSEIVPDPDPQTTVVVDGQIYDFCEYSYFYTDTYDIDNGSNIDSDGRADYEPTEQPDPDDGKFEFGCVGGRALDGTIIEVVDPTAGCYDFGDAYGQVDPENIGNGIYDFNILSASSSDWFTSGAEYWLENTPLYAVYNNKKAERIAFGRFFVYDGIICKGRVRLCEYDTFVGTPCGYSGWFETIDLINLNKPSINDYISVTGKIYRTPVGVNGSAEVEDKKYYIVSISEGETYPYGINENVSGEAIGYTDEDSITILERNSSKRSSATKKKDL